MDGKAMMPFAIGLVAGAGGMYFLKDKLDEKIALALSGAGAALAITAERAFDMGLLN